jgi:hypothetical protein
VGRREKILRLDLQRNLGGSEVSVRAGLLVAIVAELLRRENALVGIHISLPMAVQALRWLLLGY